MDNNQTVDQWIAQNQQRWAAEDTTAAVKMLGKIQVSEPTYHITPNPQIIVINDRELWHMDSQPPEKNYLPGILATVVLVVLIIIAWVNKE